MDASITTDALAAPASFSSGRSRRRSVRYAAYFPQFRPEFPRTYYFHRFMKNGVSPTSQHRSYLERRSLLRRVWCDPNLPTAMLDAMMAGDVDRVLFDAVPLQVKDRCVVGRHDCEFGPLLVKRHIWGDFWRTARMAFREPAALRCMRLGLYLNDCGFRTPRPRATVNYRIGPWTYRSYLITDYVEGTSLYRYLRFDAQTDDELRHLAAQVARLWNRLIELGISHNDLKPENFIVDENLDVWLIDLEKTRENGKADRQQARDVFDVKNFLHIRGWHHRLSARSVFAEAFLKSKHGHWLRSSVVEQIAANEAPLEHEIDADVSVIILCNGGIQLPMARQAIDSVTEFADEIVLIDATTDQQPDVLNRIDLAPHTATTSKPTVAAPLARFPWVLVLHQHESVTPFLSKELQQAITNPAAKSAFKIPFEAQYFGRTIGQHAEPAIRLFRNEECGLSFTRGELGVTPGERGVSRLSGMIQVCECQSIAEYVDRLNERSTQEAQSRYNAGASATLLRGAARAALRFAAACASRTGIRTGRTGLQIAVLEGLFAWVEEAKLRQLANEFRGATTDSSDSQSVEVVSGETSAENYLAKAA